jgi:hypothetical protein
MKSMSFRFLIILLLFQTIRLKAQESYKILDHLLQVPRQYSVIKTTEKLHIDGKAIEEAWTKALWTEAFVDIEGKAEKAAPQKTRCKMLWDNEYLYVFTQFDDPHIWATFHNQDEPVYHDNALEIFIDPDGDTHNYFEFQINALETVFDFFFPKPFRNGGSGLKGWDIAGLKKAVYINGTLNNPADIDRFWSIELAIPFKSLLYSNRGTPASGSIWKMNFSRVYWDAEIKDSSYQKKKDSTGRAKEAYWVWSPQGIVNLHYPERWGYVRFTDIKDSDLSFLNAEEEQLKLVLWKYYYLQQDFLRLHGKYAVDIDELQNAFPELSFSKVAGLSIKATDLQFIIQINSMSSNNNSYSLNDEGELIKKVAIR